MAAVEVLKIGKKLYEGKTKEVYELLDSPGRVLLQSKDQITAGNAARKNHLEGKAAISNKITSCIFQLLQEAGKWLFPVASLFVVSLTYTYWSFLLGNNIIWANKTLITSRFFFFSGCFRKRVSDSPEKAMAPHSSTLAWKIPWMEEPGRLQSMGSLGVGHN